VGASGGVSALERRLVSGIKRVIYELEPRVLVTNLKQIDRIRQIDGFHIFTWLEVLKARLQSLTIHLENSSILWVPQFDGAMWRHQCDYEMAILS
jgi:hypothetical protein